MKKLVSIIIIGLAILSSSCERYRCIEGNGIFESEDRITSSFSEVEVDGSFDVVIEYDTVTSVNVEGDQNLVQRVITEVRRDRLEIRSKDNRCLNSDSPLEITIKTPNLYEVELNGSGDIICGTFYTGYFDARINGSGIIDCEYIDADDAYFNISGSGEIIADVDAHDIYGNIEGSGYIELVGGHSRNSDYTIEGSGRIDAYKHTTDYCDIVIEGSGQIEVFVNDRLDYAIYGSGEVSYYGTAIVRSRYY